MNLPSLSIKKPVLGGVFSLLIVILGLVGLKQLGIREFPLTEAPVISVVTFYPGASPDVIASKITRPIEESLAEAGGVRTISSESREQASIILRGVQPRRRPGRRAEPTCATRSSPTWTAEQQRQPSRPKRLN